MDSLERSLGLVERELSVRLPRALWAPGALGDATAIEPESLLDPKAGVVRGGELLPDALPIARLPEGGELALRFHPSGRPAEVIRAGPGPAWHPSAAVKAFPSEADHLRRRAAASRGSRGRPAPPRSRPTSASRATPSPTGSATSASSRSPRARRSAG